MKLHADFHENMRKLLGGEYPDYLRALARPPARGLRVNTGKVSPEELFRLLNAPLTPCKYAEDGFLAGPFPYGRHPFHHAGLYYMQEPSAMCAAAALLPHMGLRVLDLCAAPGGKSAQLAAALPPEGVLVSNEIVFSRARVLMGNLERMGVRNALVTCNSPEDYARLFPEWFDSVLVDAPCSGEGMFRKEDAAVRDWNPKAVHACALRQREILDSAAKALRPGGYLLYSTCTLNTVENEETVLSFLEGHDFEPVPVPQGLRRSARPGFLGLEEAVRVFPHMEGAGEGSFACLLRKRRGERSGPQKPCEAPREHGKNFGPPGRTDISLPYAPTRDLSEAKELWARLTSAPPCGEWREREGHLLCVPPQIPLRRGLNVLKAGVTAAVRLRGRLEPHHCLAQSVRRGEGRTLIDFPADSREILAYLRGEAIPSEAPFSGFGLLAAEGFPLGLVKASGGLLKNHYPKGLRNGSP